MSLPEFLQPEMLQLGFILLFLLLIIFFMILGRGRPSRTFRSIPAFVRLRRALSLSVEAGQRLHVSLGWGGVSGLPGAAGLMGLSVLQRLTRIAAAADHPPSASSGEGTLGILSQDVLRNAARAGGAPGSQAAANGEVTGLTPFSYAAGVMPVLDSRQTETGPAVAAAFLAGHFGSEVALITEAAERSGSLTVAGSDSLGAQAVLYAAAAEPLVGEEVFAGGAYLQAGSAHSASLRAQDVLRWLLIAGILTGAALKVAGVL